MAHCRLPSSRLTICSCTHKVNHRHNSLSRDLASRVWHGKYAGSQVIFGRHLYLAYFLGNLSSGTAWQYQATLSCPMNLHLRYFSFIDTVVTYYLVWPGDTWLFPACHARNQSREIVSSKHEGQSKSALHMIQ